MTKKETEFRARIQLRMMQAGFDSSHCKFQNDILRAQKDTYISSYALWKVPSLQPATILPQ